MKSERGNRLNALLAGGLHSTLGSIPGPAGLPQPENFPLQGLQPATCMHQYTLSFFALLISVTRLEKHILSLKRV